MTPMKNVLPALRHLVHATIAGAVLLASSQARAGEDYDNCTGFIDSLPAVIGTQGTWCLRKDLSIASTDGNAIEIATNNVTIDCNHFKIGGLAAGPGTLTTGVTADGRFNATVRNCRIRGFRVGIVLQGPGGGHRVEGNHLEGNHSLGMFIAGAGSVVRGNRIIDSGGSSRSALAVEAGIEVVFGVDVIDNLISGVHPPAGSTRTAAGIYAVANAGGSLRDNRINGLVPAASGKAIGILARTVNSSGVLVATGNIIKGSAVQADAGIVCEAISSGVSDVIANDNVLMGFGTPLQGCSAGANSINTNAPQAISVAGNASAPDLATNKELP